MKRQYTRQCSACTTSLNWLFTSLKLPLFLPLTISHCFPGASCSLKVYGRALQNCSFAETSGMKNQACTSAVTSPFTWEVLLHEHSGTMQKASNRCIHLQPIQLTVLCHTQFDSEQHRFCLVGFLPKYIETFNTKKNDATGKSLLLQRHLYLQMQEPFSCCSLPSLR